MKSSLLHDIISPAITKWKRSSLVLSLSFVSKVFMFITLILLFELKYVTFSVVTFLYVQSVLRNIKLSLLPEFQEYVQPLLIFFFHYPHHHCHHTNHC